MWKLIYLIFIFNLFSFEAYALEQNDYAAELNVAQQALTKQDYATAYQEYLRVAEKKQNPLAQFTLALFYHFGWGRPVDEGLACAWYAKAAPSNIPAAQHFHANCLRDGVNATAAPTQAATWYRRAADNGHLMSLCSLAELYIEGIGVSKDTQQGLALCQQAANSGLSKAMLRMARFYLSDDPSLRNEKKAYGYLQQAAQLRNVQAQFMLGVLYRDSVGGHPVDYKMARQWFELAASLGHVPAYYQVGVLYFSAPADPATQALPAEALAKAYLWLSAAAQRTQDKDEQRKAKRLLDKIATLMPQTWLENLNEKLNEHLIRYPTVTGNKG